MSNNTFSTKLFVFNINKRIILKEFIDLESVIKHNFMLTTPYVPGDVVLNAGDTFSIDTISFSTLLLKELNSYIENKDMVLIGMREGNSTIRLYKE